MTIQKTTKIPQPHKTTNKNKLIRKNKIINTVTKNHRALKSLDSLRRIRLTLSHSQIHILNQILQISGQSQVSFCAEAISKEIDRLSLDLLGIIPGGPEADYHRLYGYWTVTRTHKANRFQYKPDYKVIQWALSQYGEDVIKRAMDVYAEIVHHPDRYGWFPVVRMEDWLLNHINDFLPDASPHAAKRYALPVRGDEG